MNKWYPPRHNVELEKKLLKIVHCIIDAINQEWTEENIFFCMSFDVCVPQQDKTER